jgi:hypothetical protein
VTIQKEKEQLMEEVCKLKDQNIRLGQIIDKLKKRKGNSIRYPSFTVSKPSTKNYTCRIYPELGRKERDKGHWLIKCVNFQRSL